MAAKPHIPRIERLTVRNYRALKALELKNLTPLTVLLGPNGSGKSTVFDVFAFLSECFTEGLRRAWDRRGRFKELRSRDADGPIQIEVKYREPGFPPITYHLSIDEESSGPVVVSEWLAWTRGPVGAPYRFLEFERGAGRAASGERPDQEDERQEETLASPEMLAVSALGQFKTHPRVMALRGFITGWHLSYLSTTEPRGTPEAGPQERLSKSGDNLANVIQYLQEQHNDQLEHILTTLASRVPALEKVEANPMDDGRLLLRLKDAPFTRPVLAKYASDGTLKMLAYLVVLYDPEPPPLIGIEEPENYLHPRLLPALAEECRGASDRSQLIVTSHSPFFVNALRPKEVWVLYRNERGYTQAHRASDMPGIAEFVDAGAQLGHLWMEGHFDVGDPFTTGRGPKRPAPPPADRKGKGEKTSRPAPKKKQLGKKQSTKKRPTKKQSTKKKSTKKKSTKKQSSSRPAKRRG